jgi:hypothetical protein
MAAPRELLGTVACLNPNCGVIVPVKKSAGGAVAASCPYCDLQAYGKEGTQAKTDILAMMTPAKAAAAPIPDPAPAAKPAATPAAPPAPPKTAPAKRATATIFG